MQAQAALGATHLDNVAADNAASGAQKVTATAAKEDESNKPLTKEERRAQGRAAAKAAKEGK